MLIAASVFLYSLVSSTGCIATRMPAPHIAEQLRVRVVAPSPEKYVLRLRMWDPVDKPVGKDGLALLDLPTYRHGCNFYVFNVIPLQRSHDPLTEKQLEVMAGGKVLRRLSLTDLRKLAVDAEGNYLLKPPPARP